MLRTDCSPCSLEEIANGGHECGEVCCREDQDCELGECVCSSDKPKECGDECCEACNETGDGCCEGEVCGENKECCKEGEGCVNGSCCASDKKCGEVCCEGEKTCNENTQMCKCPTDKPNPCGDKCCSSIQFCDGTICQDGRNLVDCMGLYNECQRGVEELDHCSSYGEDPDSVQSGCTDCYMVMD